MSGGSSLARRLALMTSAGFVVIWLLAGRSPIAFFKGVREPMVVAFSTASSNASLPVSLKAAEEQLHLPRKIARFVLTVGATANQNGTALFEGVTVIFLAQFFGVDLSIGQQIMVMAVCILGGIGTAGVPSGSLPVVAMILVMVGVPAEGIGLILGVDRFLDMCRTTLNVTGDLALATIDRMRDVSESEAPESKSAERAAQRDASAQAIRERETVRQAGVAADGVGALYFTGGSTGLQLLTARLEAAFPQARAVHGVALPVVGLS
mgnify:CR=1 FL=1